MALIPGNVRAAVQEALEAVVPIMVDAVAREVRGSRPLSGAPATAGQALAGKDGADGAAQLVVGAGPNPQCSLHIRR